MAGENVGTIYYTVEAETSGLVNGTQAADGSLDRLERPFGKTDRAASETRFTMTKTAAAIRGMGSEALHRYIEGCFGRTHRTDPRRGGI